MTGAQSIAAMVPRHVVHRNLLPADEHAALIDWALSIPDRFVSSSLGPDRHVDPSARSSFSVSEGVLPPWHMRLYERYRALAPRLTRELGMAAFEVAEIEFDLVAYNDGAFYEPHIDMAVGRHRAARADRIVTTVYYFHAEPKGFTGGALRLHALAKAADGSRAFVDIEPEQNSLVAFAASTLHEVRPVRCPSGKFRDSRFAINGWLRRASAAGSRLQ